MCAFLRSVVTGEDSAESEVGARLLGDLLVNVRVLAFGRTRKR